MHSNIKDIAIINMLIKKVSAIFLIFACKDNANQRQYKTNSFVFVVLILLISK